MSATARRDAGGGFELSKRPCLVCSDRFHQSEVYFMWYPSIYYNLECARILYAPGFFALVSNLDRRLAINSFPRRHRSLLFGTQRRWLVIGCVLFETEGRSRFEMNKEKVRLL